MLLTISTCAATVRVRLRGGRQFEGVAAGGELQSEHGAQYPRDGGAVPQGVRRHLQGHRGRPGEAVQIDPNMSMLKASGVWSSVFETDIR
jgi:hypothetical protein